MICPEDVKLAKAVGCRGTTARVSVLCPARPLLQAPRALGPMGHLQYRVATHACESTHG